MVPNGWIKGRTGDLIKSLDAGVSVNSIDKYISSKKYILKTSCLSSGIFNPNKLKTVISPIEITRLKEPLQKNSLLISRMNTPALVGANAYIKYGNESIFLPDRLWQVKLKNKNISMHWLSYWFGSEKTRHILSSLGTGTSGSMKNISKSDVLKIKILIPPFLEQQKIAKILSTWDKAIDATEKLISNSQTQKRALMQQLLTGKKRLLDENGERFSEKWEKVPLSSKIIFSNLKSTKKDEYPIITSSRKGIFLQEDYFKKQVASENNIGYKVVPRDYITYRSMSDDGIFVFNKQTILDKAIISPAYGVFKFINLDASFGLYAMNSKHMIGKINTFSQGGTRIALKTSVLSNIKIHIPSLLEQKKIAEVISNADREIELLQAKLEHLKQEKKALMQQLLTGKRRVKANN